MRSTSLRRPPCSISRIDYFGNAITGFSIEEPHQTLTVSARSEIEVRAEEPPASSFTPPWEDVRETLAHDPEGVNLRTAEFLLRSPLVRTGADFAAWATPSFPAGRPLLEAVQDLSHRIYTEFRYDPRATTVSTPVEEVLHLKTGVCQDFSHVMISCLRSMGLAARYVSGYLRSGESTRGAEASHAWCSVWFPDFGWLDFDPTNDVMPRADHVHIGWGRDYSDVAPVKGVAIGGGEQLINVSVEVR